MPSDLGLITDAVTSVVSPRDGIPRDAMEVWNDGSTFRAVTPRDSHTPGGVASPKTVVRNVFQGSRTIDGSFFNLHIYDPGAVGLPTDIEYHGVRLHDVRGPINGAGLRWHNIHSATSTYDWSNLDAVADQFYDAGKKLLYMVIGTPNWCASATPGNGKYDNGTTATGTNQVPTTAGKTRFAEFAAALATRYNGTTKGLIDTYEVWNEVNYTSYWAGTHAQYAELLRIFRNAVRGVNASLKVGAPTIQEPEGTGDDWLATFLDASDGAAGTGKDHLDYCFVHLYPPRYNFGVAWDQVDRVRTILDAEGLTSLEIWNTETGVLVDPERDIAEEWKARMVKRTLALNAAKGVKRYYWYTYDNPNMSMSSEMKDAWAEMRDVLIGNTIQNCNILPDERVCITINGREYTY
jgi:hypothetical protein